LALYAATPSIAVEQPLGINLTAGSASVDFGTTVPVGDAVELTFTVRNTGLGELTGLGLTLDGTDEGDFSVTLDPASVLAVGDTTTFTVRFVPSSAGAKSAALHLASNDAVENLFDIALSGTAGFSEIAVEQPAANDLIDGSASVDFGTAAFAGSMIERTFTVQSLGTADVTGLSITFDGTDADDFSVIASPASTVAPGNSTTFTVRFLPSSAGVKTAALHLASNDADESPFDIELTGAVTATLSANYSTGTDVPLTAAGFTGTGNSVNFTLNYAPIPGTSLMLVNNTASAPGNIQGTFDNLANGAAVDLTFGGTIYHFVAWYYGGDGNDLVLIWRDTGLAAWGDNADGQLGDGSTTQRTVPVEVTQSGVLAGKTIVALSTGSNHNLALCADGTLAVWGNNQFRQLGDGSYTDRSVPVDVTQSGVLAGKTVVSIAAGSNHGLALCSDGTLAAWGYNSSGQLGDGSTTSRNVPVAVDQSGVLAGKTIVALAGGLYHSLALCSDGTLAAWGRNDRGQLGDGSTTNRSVPVDVTQSGVLAGKTVVAIGAVSYHSLALCADGTLAGWGYNGFSQLGDGSNINRNVPVAVDQSGVLADKNVVSLAAGGSHSLALCADGTLAAWGSNSSGQFGDGSTSSSDVPVAVDQSGPLSSNAVLALAAGNRHSLALYAATPSIAVEQPLGVNLTAGSASTDFGTTVPVGEAVELTFTVRNTGLGELTGLGLTLDGTDVGDFSVTLDPASMLAVGDTTTFTVRFVPSSAGAKSAALHLASNEAVENLFDIALSGTAGFPEIALEQPAATDLTDGSASIDFGAVALAGTMIERTFTVQSLGTADVTGLSITFDGTDASDFSVSASPASAVAPGNSTTFTVRFLPSSAGVKTAALHLASNDADESPFDIALAGSASNTLLTANYTTGTEVPLTTPLFTATGNTVNFTLDYAPLPGTHLMVVNNTGSSLIVGTFENLANGAAVDLTFGGKIYHFVAWYYGGDGNDLVLIWRHTGLAAWGNNALGQLGDDSIIQSNVPVNVDQSGVLAGKTVIALASGVNHSMVLCSDGTLAAWGDNEFGQLGDGSTTQSTIPVDVTQSGVLAGKSVVSITCGLFHSLALCSDGTLAAWGQNDTGQLGDGSTTQSNVPVAVDRSGVLAGKSVVALAAGYRHSLVLCSDGTLAAWGENADGQLGDGSTTQSTVPVAVTTAETPLVGKTIVALDVGVGHNLVLCSDGTLAAWGNNSSGQLGDGSTTDRSVPVAVTQSGVLAGKTVVALDAGYNHSLALCSDGTLAAWGRNGFGALGDGTTTSSSVPVVVTTAETPLASKTVVAFDAGGAHNLALCSDGSLAAWGNNSTGQLGDGSTSTSTTPVAVDQSGVLAGKTVVALAPNGTRSLVLYAVPLPPEIGVEQPADNALADDSASIDFGDTVPGESAVERTFTVRNFGSADLTGLSITLDGTDASDFSVTAAGASVLAPGATTTFTVSFAPASVGAKSAALHLASNDADESPFDIVLTGNGAQLTPLETWRQKWFGSAATNNGAAANSADPHHTGIPNILVFAFFGPDQDPATAMINQLPQVTNNGDFFTYQFTEPAGVSGISYGAEWSGTLQAGSWLPVTDTGSETEHIFSVPMDSGKKFLRLTVD
jgi:alpha-tubulin suppressor-like RCC1 family protein